MTIDKYQPCPCGSGKKIKFCCSADLVAELDKIQRMLDGKQWHACLEYVTQLLEKFPGRPSLLSVKALLENQLGETADAEKTISTFLEQSPDSPVALAEQARLLAHEHKPLEAATALQKALAAAEGAIPARVFAALGDVAVSLLEAGHLFAARAHLLLHASLGGEEESRSAQILMEMNLADELPLLLKQDNRFADAPAGASYAKEFAAAIDLVGKAQWLAALQKFTALSERHGREAPIWRNMAILRGFLGDDDGAAKAWRRYASLVEETSLSDAVEGEALAQVLAKDGSEEVEVVDITLEIRDLDRAMEVMLGDRKLLRLPVDLASLAEENSPPPKGVFSLLDREMPASGDDLTLAAVPNAYCDFYVYGRETDRPARIELTVPRTKLDAVKKSLGEILGETLGGVLEEQIAGHVDSVQEAMHWAWRMPEGTPRELRQSLFNEQRRRVMFDVWPTLKQRLFDGKSPQQAAGDPKYRVRMLGAILLLDLSGQQERWQFDFNELRTKLGLPQMENIDPASVDFDRLPLVRYARLDAAKLPTDRLLALFQYAAMMKATSAIRVLGDELAKRNDLPAEVSKSDLFGLLAQSAATPEDALGFIEQARDAAKAAGQSTARWLLSELPIRLQLRQVERLQHIIDEIQTKHSREPGIMNALMGMLMRLGLIQPGGMPGRGAMPAELAAPAAGGGLWTPDGGAAQPAAAAPAGEKKSGLWLPGMD